jgi:hypothetical protein
MAMLRAALLMPALFLLALLAAHPAAAQAPPCWTNGPSPCQVAPQLPPGNYYGALLTAPSPYLGPQYQYGVVPPAANDCVVANPAGDAWMAAPCPTTGITQLTGDVAAGPGIGSQSATVVQGSNTTKGKLQCDGTTATCTNGVVSVVAGASGISQLTGDVTAGPGVGSQPTILANINQARVDLGLNVNGALAIAASGAPAQAACADLSNAGTACLANTGTSGHALGFLDGNNTSSGNNTHTGTETFGPVIGAIGNGGTAVSGTTYTFAAADCGTLVTFTSSSAVTATIPASIVPATTVCSFGVLQAGTAKVSVNGSAVSAATLISPDSFTGTNGVAGSMIGLTLLTVGAGTNAYLTGAGS